MYQGAYYCNESLQVPQWEEPESTSRIKTKTAPLDSLILTNLAYKEFWIAMRSGELFCLPSTWVLGTRFRTGFVDFVKGWAPLHGVAQKPPFNFFQVSKGHVFGFEWDEWLRLRLGSCSENARSNHDSKVKEGSKILDLETSHGAKDQIR